MEKFLPQKIEKEVISMRIASDMLANIDKKATKFEMSRNELINQCIAFALANMDTAEKE